MIFKNYKPTVTTVSGDWSGNIGNTRGLLRQIYVKSNTTSTTFDIKITNSDSIEVYYIEGITGELNELLTLPINGNYTFAVENSSADEAFDVNLTIQEQ